MSVSAIIFEQMKRIEVTPDSQELKMTQGQVISSLSKKTKAKAYYQNEVHPACGATK
jgi:hypothetical protein